MEKVDITQLGVKELKVLVYDKSQDLANIKNQMKQHPLTKAAQETEMYLRLINDEITKRENGSKEKPEKKGN